MPGGFAYGDYWRAGVLASRSPIVSRLQDFVENKGLVVGICNGFQILVEAGLLPGALWFNRPPGFRHRWIEVSTTESASKSPWFHDLPQNTRLRIPMANGEGNYQPAFDANAMAGVHVPLKYADNPNGSYHDAAAITDPTGRILGVMPHPERACSPFIGSDDGLKIFQSARTYFQ